MAKKKSEVIKDLKIEEVEETGAEKNVPAKAAEEAKEAIRAEAEAESAEAAVLVNEAADMKEEISLEEQLKEERLEKERLQKELEKKEAQERKYLRKKKRIEFFNKPLTRKFVMASLALAVLANAAVTAAVVGLSARNSNKGKNEMFYENGPGMPDDRYGNRQRDYQFFGDDQYGNQYGNDQGFNSDNSQNQNLNQNNRDESKASIGIVIKEDNGVYIAQITGDNAKKAGFKEGDKIVAIDGKEISGSDSLIDIVKSHNPGDSVSVTVERDGQKVEIKTVLE